MSFKINISEKSGKTYKLEVESETFLDKSISEKLNGKEISSDLEGYEFEITGASDKSGFPALENIEGFQKKRVLLGYGKGMRKRPKREGKKKQTTPTPGGLRMRKTIRGKIISPEIVQINLKILKQGNKKLSEIFPEQNAKDIPLQNSEEKSEAPKAKQEEKEIKSTEKSEENK